jgi:hypothetical protein
MKTDQLIYFPESHAVRSEPTNTYHKTYRKFKYKWVCRLWDKAFDYAIKKGYLQQTVHTSWDRQITAVKLDLNRLDEQIAKNQQAIEMVHNNRLECIIVGHDVMSKIMNGKPQYLGYQEVTLDGPSKHAMYGRAYPDPLATHGGLNFVRHAVYYMGLRVKLVPWFEGFLLIPKE